ncbi:MAG: acetate--CoA ligase [Hyphomicrobiales bacterium]|nr:MAG: acetate--CoA ligase [Hyphomicrobiales bacterium]
MSAKKSWQPQPRHFTDANALKLASVFGLSDFDSLLKLSVDDPERYWRGAMSFLKFRWDEEPTGYVDLTRGTEFPAWFPGGRLNWVNTVLARAHDPDFAGRVAVVAEDEDGNATSLTFAELAVAVRRLAAGLRKQGIAVGDRVGLLIDNGIEATLSVMALSYIGAIFVPLFSGFGHEAVISRLESAGAKALIAATGFVRRGRIVDVAQVVREACRQLPAIEKVIWKRAPGTDLPEHGIDFVEVASAPDDGAPARSMSPMDPFLVIYTSGTTGKPKGAVHTHGGFPLRIAHDSAVHFNVSERDVFCWPADMGWIAGTLILSVALLRGATLILYTGAPDFPDWSRMSRLVETYGATHFGSSPTLIRGLAANEELALKHDRSTLRTLITAGEVIDAEHFLWFQDSFGANDSPVINYTGGTEVSGGLLSSVQVRPIAPGGFNTVTPAIDVIVADPDGNPVVGEIGELAMRQPFIGMTASFWQDDERYLDSYWSQIPGMWVHGDLAFQAQDGSYLIMGRSDDTIKVAGKRLGPAEVEEVVLEFDEVSEAAAVGIAHPVKGQMLVLFLVLAPGEAPDGVEPRAAAAVAERLGKPFKPTEVYVVSQLPKTRSGKIMRRLVRHAYSGTRAGDISSLDNPEALEEIAALAKSSAA